MKSSWFPILMIVALLGLLVLLATLQYQWLGQISDTEQIRLESRLKDDTKRFADDFDNEIQNAYFSFHFTADNFDSLGNVALSKSYKVWKENTAYKDLIKDFYYVNNENRSEYRGINEQNGEFTSAKNTIELGKIEKSFEDEDNIEKFSQDGFALVVPIQKSKEEVKELIGNLKSTLSVKKIDGKVITENIIGPKTNNANLTRLVQEIKVPTTHGFLIIRLNEDVVKAQILPDLTAKYFSQTGGGSYKLSILDKNNNQIFQTHNESLEKGDFQTRLFDIKPQNLFFFARENNLARLRTKSKNKVVISSSVSSGLIRDNSTSGTESETVDLDIIENETHIIGKNGKTEEDEGYWMLKVQHNDGSLEQFISNTRRKNLAISFGILSLLAISIILIFLSSQRAKSLAQKQMDFVSSVSHEFRTPLAVIYSASENLSDGVVDEQEKIADYGGLIKREGKKLSGMVEQILEFAGANSGKRKFDFKNVKVQEIINEAVAECQSTIDEKDFEMEIEIASELPNIIADEKALTLAVQNLINNALKYNKGSKWLKVSAENGDGAIKIIVEDKGIGISSKDKKRIFEPFYRSENVVDEQISGNGLGLSLVKQIIDAHQGTIDVESVVGKGSKFIVNLQLEI